MSIQIENLTHEYNKGTPFSKLALDNVNLTIEDGTFVGLIGHTGSGKSTLIQHLNGLLKPTDENSKIIVFGKNINTKEVKLKEVRQQIGLVFQYPEHQLFEVTVYKDVAFGPKNLGLSDDEIDKLVKKSLSTVGMGEEYYEKSPFELSGGQKRKVAIAGVLAMNPKILILDEPAAGLDPESKEDLLGNIKKMKEEFNITVILVSHSMDDISKMADRIIVMDKGRIVYDDVPSKVFVHGKELEKIGLDVPEISKLMDKLNDNGLDVPNDVYDLDEATKIIYDLIKEKTKW